MASGFNFGPGTSKSLNVKRKEWKVTAGAIEHKNRPEAVYMTFSSWVTPKLSIVKAKASSTSDPQELSLKTAKDFDAEVQRAGRKFSSSFDTTYFDPNSIIWMVEYVPMQSKSGMRQFFEVEINIDTVNETGWDERGNPTIPDGAKTYSFKDLEPHIAKAIDKILSMEVFDINKSMVTFSNKKAG